MRHDVATLARATAVTSYSPLDVQWLREQGIDAHHLPNAFDRDRQVVRPMARRDEISFVGARYPDREQTLVGAARRRRAGPRLRPRLVAPPGRPAAHLGLAPAGRAGRARRRPRHGVRRDGRVRGHAQHAHRPGRLRDAHLRGVRRRRRPADRPARPGRPLRRRRRGRHAGETSRSCSSCARGPGSTRPGRRDCARPAAAARSPSTPSTTGSPSLEDAVGLNHPRDLDAWHALAALALAVCGSSVDRFRPRAPARRGTLTVPAAEPRVLVALDGWRPPA